MKTILTLTIAACLLSGCAGPAQVGVGITATPTGDTTRVEFQGSYIPTCK